ncbi:glycoside hydrolase family 31 [Rhodanobacter sp. B05]|uniref:glycoside hydrolase family 31 protein n=1 Tax=Rhodanobacter sp. B05 TaxID=1945859 RepID=UPI000985C8E2|nr:TIM-barrel domain-containing protein [Rhodanobacter sp. B05]OOG54602.1 glycoside hydrolase family 31 [Rhodanobacter sp. B05]
MFTRIPRTLARHAIAAALAAGLLLSAPICAADTASAPAASLVHADTQGVAFRLGSERLSIRLDGAGVVHVQALPAGASDSHTLVLDPHAKPVAVASAHVHDDGATLTLASDRLVAIWHKQANTLELQNAQRHPLLTLDLATLAKGQVQLTHAADDALYGIHGYDKDENASSGLLRSGAQVAKAGEQGYAGAPFVWSTAGYGVLVDSNGANYALQPGRIEIGALSKPSLDVYLMAGDPPQLFDQLATLSGRAPLFPKWAMGFTNSQWGIDQKELLQIVDTYRAKHIPLDNFTLDFDWKAWGEDDYGEFRWNPVKFPGGPTGALAKQLHARGIQLTGIMKPRIHVDTVEGRYATEHHFWVPDEKASDDYFSHKPVKNIDFDIPAARTWFGDLAVKYGFDEGIAGWWNDEADTTGSDTEFMNMQRALYEAQRRVSDLRVWSINRNFWLGAQRYAYGLWSGDIDTGFKSMAAQRPRMLSAINLGEMSWGMDGGGFNGHPSDENYARWIEFGAFTPIFRVHGTFGEKRQPWVYGPVAEKAATAAIRLRYSLIPYIYSYEYQRHVDGVGLVRPLIFDWPHDENVRNDIDSWMFGDYLLVSPVVQQAQTEKHIYLPAGTWTDWFSGKVYQGGQTIRLAIDDKGWGDIPLFIRDGAIIPTQPVMDYVGEKPVTELAVEVFPSSRRSTFDVYDDDGTTYAYEHGDTFLQTLAVQRQGQAVTFETDASSGAFKPALRFYLLKIHGDPASSVSVDGKPMAARASVGMLQQADTEGWARGHDRFGAVTWVRIAAGRKQTVRLHLSSRGGRP